MEEIFYLVKNSSNQWLKITWMGFRVNPAENIFDATLFNEKSEAEEIAHKYGGDVFKYRLTSDYSRQANDAGYTFYAVKLGGKLWLATKHYKLYPSTTYDFLQATYFEDIKEAQNSAKKCNGKVVELSLLPAGNDAYQPSSSKENQGITSDSKEMELLRRENELLKREMELNKREAEIAKKEKHE